MCWSVEEAGCVPCINAAVLIERVVALAKRESKGVGVRHVSRGLLQGIRFANRFFFCFSAHACCEGDFALYLP